MNAKLILSLSLVLVSTRESESQNCFSSPSSSTPYCLSYFKFASCSCSGSCSPVQQISQDISTLKSIVTSIEQRDPSSCFYFNNSAIKYHPRCCSFPYTQDGELYFKCTSLNATSAPGCYLQDRVWVECSDPNYVVNYELKNIAVPTFPIQMPVLTLNGWIVFQQRLNKDESFNRLWNDYVVGFGNPATNFWMGLEKIYQTCNKGNCRLRLEAFTLTTNSWTSLEYSIFFLGSEYEAYAIHFVGSSGDGDAYFSSRPNPNGVINGMRFTTSDKDQDTRPTENCANIWHGGWWYNNCHWYNFNGDYTSMGFSLANGNIRLRSTRMMMKMI